MMTQDWENSDAGAPITAMERLLREASAAESAGVFDQTRVDANRLLRESSQAPVPLSVTIGRKWIPVAAAVGIAVVVTSAMFYVNLANISRQSRIVSQTIRHDAMLANNTADRDADRDAARAVPTSPGHGATASAVGGSAFIAVCVNGPAAGDSAKCRDRHFDYDTDGDIDLADFSHYQLAFVQ